MFIKIYFFTKNGKEKGKRRKYIVKNVMMKNKV